MSDMPERIWAFRWPEGRRTWRDETMFAPDFAVEYHRADAPLTPAEAMARCPEVAALVDFCVTDVWRKARPTWDNTMGNYKGFVPCGPNDPLPKGYLNKGGPLPPEYDALRKAVKGATGDMPFNMPQIPKPSD